MELDSLKSRGFSTDENNLVFINGVYSARISGSAVPPGAVLSDLTAALTRRPEMVKPVLGSDI